MASYTSHGVFEVHPCFNTCQQFIPCYCWIVSIVWIDHVFSIPVPVDEYLFIYFGTMSNAAMNNRIQPLCGQVVRPWVDTYRSVITVSYGNFVFNFLRNWQTIDGTILHFYQQHIMVLGLFLGSQCIPLGRLHFE